MNNKVSVLLIISGAFLFNALFWEEQMALNVLLFDVFIAVALIVQYKNAFSNNTVKTMLLLNVVSLFAVLVFNSLLSKLAFTACLFLLAAFTAYRHRSVWFAGGSLLNGFTGFGFQFFRLLNANKTVSNKKWQLGRLFRFAILPILAATCFFIVYSSANTIFAGMAGHISSWLEKFTNYFFGLFSFSRLFFLLFGLYLTGVMLLRNASSRFEQREAGKTDTMRRIRKKRMDLYNNFFYEITVGIMGKLAKGMMALRNEYRTGLLSLLLLNILLLIINIIDINYLWINFTYTPAIDLFTMIHEGTELLILSIVMAMLLLLVFFRGNLNFYRNNKWLRYGAYIWLLQNTILVVSVFIRDYYYIREFGLAYKRIGVLFFLLLVLAGLLTVFLKVKYAKTNYYLFKINAWFVLILLVAGTLIQWDVFITEYNIAHRKTAPLNLPYLLTLSDKVLPVLDQNLPVLKEREKELNDKQIYLGRCSNCIEEVIATRSKDYLIEQQAYSWLSWNFSDASIKRYFNKPALVAVQKQ